MQQLQLRVEVAESRERAVVEAAAQAAEATVAAERAAMQKEMDTALEETSQALEEVSRSQARDLARLEVATAR
jgi:hypothetical protein